MKDGVITINVGKKGINDNLIKEINLLLEKKGIVKVRMLRNFRNSFEGEVDRKVIAREIEKKVDGKLVDLRGFVMTFERC